MYGKLFDAMYDGTLAGHWQAIVTLQQLVILANADGVVDMTVEAIARRTTIPERIISAGITFLLLPDQYSRTPGEDGKRIVPIDEHRPWGWRIVNHGKYKRLRNMEEKREADRERQAEKRNKNKDVAIESQKSPSVAKVAHAYADADAKKNNARAYALPAWVPHDAWKAFDDSRTKLRKPMTDRARSLVILELEKLKDAGHDPRDVLEQSVRRGWLDVFPLKEQMNSQAIKVDL